MRVSIQLALLALMCCVVHGFSSPILLLQQPRTGTTGTQNVSPNNMNQFYKKHLTSRGGAVVTKTTGGEGRRMATSPAATGSKCPATGAATIAASIWGAGGVIYILAKAIKRVIPIAMEPFQAGSIPLNNFQLGAYVITCLWFAYVEGFKGFQQKFSPLVVKRAFTLIPGKNGTQWYHFLLAPLYSMGLMHATKKRMIVSWSVTTGVAVIVAAVKKLPYPYRNIIDAGVVAGLTWGSLSIMLLYIKSWIVGAPPAADANLPEAK